MIMDCLVESIMKNAKDSLRYYLPMIPLQVLFLVGCSKSSLHFLGNFGLYNLMFQALFHLQYILLSVEDLTAIDTTNSRFPGYDYLVTTLPFAVQLLSEVFPSLLSFSPYS